MTECRFCHKEIDTSLVPPSQERKVLRWHWSCFQFLAMNGQLHVCSPTDGEDITALILSIEFEKDGGEQ